MTVPGRRYYRQGCKWPQWLIFAPYFIMRLIIPLIFAVSVAFGQPSGQDQKVLFSVAGTPVTSSEFEYLFRKNHQNRPEEFTPAGIQEYLRLYINFKLKVTEARNRGMDTTKAFQKEFEGYRKEVRKSYGAQRDDTDALVREAWDRMQKEVRASHILLMGGEELNPEDTLRLWNKLMELRQRAMNGEDFDELAKKYSEDPSAAKEGADLGFFSALEMVYPFETAAFNTPRGGISMPVRTRFGYHLVKVKDVRPATGEIEVSHIAVRTEEGKEQQAKDRIFELAERLRGGGDWLALCKEYSDDAGSKDNGGQVRPFRRGTFEKSAPAFEEAAFSLKEPGEISDPVQTSFGWHILRLERIIPMPGFEAAKADLVRRVTRNERVQLSRNRQLEGLRKSFGFQEDLAVRKELSALADTTLQYGKWKYRGTPELLPKTLFTLNGRSFKVSEFKDFAETGQTPGTAEPAVLMRRLIENFINEAAIAAEDMRLERENPSYRMLLQEYREGILLFTIMDQEVWTKASADSTGQRKFYDQHLKRYEAGDRIHARLFSTSDSTLVTGILDRIGRGDTLRAADLKKFRNSSPFRNYARGESRVTDQVPWRTGFHRVKVDNQYYLVEIDNLVAPGIRSFQEARASVISDYQDELEKQWIGTLSARYPVSVNRQVKRKVIRRLQSNPPKP